MIQNIQNFNDLSTFLNTLPFTFNDEDNVSTFNKIEYLLNIPTYKLYELAKYYKISKYKKLAKSCLASQLLNKIIFIR